MAYELKIGEPVWFQKFNRGIVVDKMCGSYLIETKRGERIWVNTKDITREVDH